MTHYNFALLGFGNVGRSFARLLTRKEAELKEQYDLGFSVTAILTGRHGGAIDHRGLDLKRALEIVEDPEGDCSLNELSAQPVPDNALDFIAQSGADVMFENSPVNYLTGEPALGHLREALELGMIGITANKGPVVHGYRVLTELARKKGVKFLFESTVMDGAPIFSLFREALPAAQLRSLHGIFNSTTNLILTRMEGGESLDEAIRYAQSVGVAETDPSGDVDGWDAAVKVAALVTVLMDIPLKPDQVDRHGIREISQADIAAAQKAGKRWKLICSAERDGRGVRARVAPEMVEVTSPFYGVSGTTSLAQFETDVLGKLTVIEEDPGPDTTAYGLLADFVNAVKSD